MKKNTKKNMKYQETKLNEMYEEAQEVTGFLLKGERRLQ